MAENNATIAAISTPPGIGGIGTIRISGDNALKIADSSFKACNKKPITLMKGYTAAYGKVFDGETAVDEAVCLVFKAPHSYTGENTVEITCHSGTVILQTVLRVLFKNGAVPAKAGEFTKRAFLNGKIDLSQAEGVMALISAKGRDGANAALNLLEGSMSRKIEEINAPLITAVAQLGAWVDYPYDEIEALKNDRLLSIVKTAYKKLDSLLLHYDAGIAVTQGVPAAIVGKPNTGKSTLMNLLSGYERSIVTCVAGTTRDTIEEEINFDGTILKISDTAGIRETGDEVEKIGVELSKKKIERAAIVLAVFDISKPFSKEDEELTKLCKAKPAIAVINKNDLPQKLDLSVINAAFDKTVIISAKNKTGYKQLCSEIKALLGTDTFDPSAALIANERQRKCCELALTSLKEAENALLSGITLDAVEICISDAIGALLEINGQKATDAVIEDVFKNFCVGK